MQDRYFEDVIPVFIIAVISLWICSFSLATFGIFLSFFLLFLPPSQSPSPIFPQEMMMMMMILYPSLPILSTYLHGKRGFFKKIQFMYWNRFNAFI